MMLYPAVSPDYWNNCDSGQLYSIYNMLDWYYAPLIIDPQLPFMAISSDKNSLKGMKGLNSLDNIKTTQGGPADRLRPLIGPYAEAYVQFFPMAGIESILMLECNKGDWFPSNDETCSKPWTINPAVGGDTIGVGIGANPGWLSDPSSNNPPPLDTKNYSEISQWFSPSQQDIRNFMARPLMGTFYIQPYGIARQGFPNYAYVELVDFTFENGGQMQEANTDGYCQYGTPDTPKLRSFCASCNNTPQDLKNAFKFGVAKPASWTDSQGQTQYIKGSAYTGNDNGNISGWGGPLKEDYQDTSQCTGKVILDSSLKCLCFAKSSGVTDNPNIDPSSLVPGTKVKLGNRCVADVANCDLLYSLTPDHKPYQVGTTQNLALYKKSHDGSFTKVNPKDVVYCAPSKSTDWSQGCSGELYRDLFYPIKGYGKFLNLGRTATYFNYVHALIAANDRDQPYFGVQFRRPLSEICAEHPGGGCCTPSAGWKCISSQVSDLAGFGWETDNREYLSGYITVPRKDKFPGTGLAAYEDAILKGGGGSLEWTAPSGETYGVW